MTSSESPWVDRLPIKLIMPNQGKEKKNPSGGAPPKPFRTVDVPYRKRLSAEVSAISDAVLPYVKRIGSAPFRAKLLPKAIAKSHRPERLFSDDTCPIIGVGRLGELFLKATPDGLNKLRNTIENDQTQQVVKELSSVEVFEPITPVFRIKGVEPKDVLRWSPRRDNTFVTRISLFNVGDADEQTGLVEDFKRVCKERDIHIKPEGYSSDSFVYGVGCHTVEDVVALTRVVGVKTVVSMPLVRTIKPQTHNPKPIPKLRVREDYPGDVPVVVVVDSGISDQIPELNSWVIGRESKVAPVYRNPEHGTFVAGLISCGSVLNPTFSNIDPNPCAIFDFQVLPNGDPAKGPIEFFTEQEFLVSLEEVLGLHANEYKVWNLSLGTSEVCSLDEFSSFAQELDNLQEKYSVSFVISAGNFQSPPLLDFPRTPSQMEVGRITVPSDSVLGISVGSISHVDYKDDGPKMNEPSAFSRHGAGPNYIIKPDLVHYGGACSVDVSHISGIRSLGESGSVENIGTSFSAPLVSKTLAQIYHQVTPTPQPVLARALLTHHARDPRTLGRVPDGEENYFGFGIPSAVPDCLECTPYSSTLVFEDALRPGFFLEWDDFPYPTALKRDGRYFGEIWMTVAFSPERGARWGSEYCETHIDAHFGVIRDHVSRKTGEITTSFTGLVPPEHKNPGALYESYQVEKLRKWAPVRTYYGDLGENGERGERWRLAVKLLTRHGIEDVDSFKPQPFSLIITISDPRKIAPVYDEMARIVRSRFQAQNLTLRATARIQRNTLG
ncbi:putative serine protease [Dehalogenimonas sp. WBC-2]|nr:putative serine protease [Dehalogenimonas sp. WBC-2]